MAAFPVDPEDEVDVEDVEAGFEEELSEDEPDDESDDEPDDEPDDEVDEVLESPEPDDAAASPPDVVDESLLRLSVR